MRHKPRLFRIAAAAAALAGLQSGLLVTEAISAPKASGAAQYSGKATVVDAMVLSTRTTLVQAAIPPGTSSEASLLEGGVPGTLAAEILHAATVARGNEVNAEASVANVNLTVGANTITADLLMARARSSCPDGNALSSEFANLTINGIGVGVSAPSNTTIPLVGGRVVLNEQIGSTNTVNALHVVVDNVADIVISSASTSVTGCPQVCTKATDRVTGGGFVTTSTGSRGNFGVAGGTAVKGGFWGHLAYVDHGRPVKVHGTGVTAYSVTGPTSRHIEGTATVNGQPGFTYQVDVNDNGEPGRSDTFWLRLAGIDGYRYETASVDGTLLAGGNIQLHKAATCR